MDFRLELGGKNARGVVCDAAAGDVDESAEPAFLMQRLEQRSIAAVRRQQFFIEPPPQFRNAIGKPNPGLVDQHLAGKRIAVGVKAERGQTQDQVAGTNSAAVQDLPLPHPAHDAAGQVVFIRRIKARHLGGLSADERAANFAAGVGKAAHNVGDDLSADFSRCQIVQKEERPRAVHCDVVGRMEHEVACGTFMPVGGKSDLELGAHAVHAGNQHGVGGKPLEREESSKGTDISQHTGIEGPADQFFNL